MTFAYDEIYLPQARETMGAMFDYAVWDCKVDIDRFFDLFLVSGLADRFGRGDPTVVAGKSAEGKASQISGILISISRPSSALLQMPSMIA